MVFHTTPLGEITRTLGGSKLNKTFLPINLIVFNQTVDPQTVLSTITLLTTTIVPIILKD
jgi:hypothetical protein